MLKPKPYTLTPKPGVMVRHLRTLLLLLQQILPPPPPSADLAAKRYAVRQGLEWDGGREWNRRSRAWAESSTPAAALDGSSMRLLPREVYKFYC